MAEDKAVTFLGDETALTHWYQVQRSLKVSIVLTSVAVYEVNHYGSTAGAESSLQATALLYSCIWDKARKMKPSEAV